MNKIVTGVFVLFILTLSGWSQDKTARDYKIEAAEAYNAKDYVKGLEAFEKAIVLYEDAGEIDTSLYFNAAVCAYKSDDYEKAVSYFTTSLNMGYKSCSAMLFKANSLRKLEKYDEMEEICNQGTATCKGSADKFNEILLNYYRKEGLEIYNNAAKVQAAATPLIQSDKAKYDSEMEKVKTEFRRALIWLNKAKNIDPADQSVNDAIDGANKVINGQ
ncbi:MAG: hypothetical protein JXA03_00895 [Bacteroidales bacterium]|nr:hypothetical protein [Bacteroidales bacterium]